MTLFELPPPAVVPEALIKLDPSAGYTAFRNQGVSPMQAAKKVVEVCCALDVADAHLSDHFDNYGVDYYFKGVYFGQSLEIATVHMEDEIMILDGVKSKIDVGWTENETYGPTINRKLKNAIIKIFFELGEYHYQKMKQ